MTVTAGTPVAVPADRRPARVLVGVALLVAIGSVALPAALTYDAWAWLQWGRELGRLELDTTGGPSWKPLPVAVTTVLAPLGSAAVPVFVVLVRTTAVLAVMATFRLAARFGGAAAGLVAVAALVLTPDGDPRFLRLVAESHPEPASAALVLLALDAHLDGRRRWALGAGWALALLRPEAWPFLAGYVAWLWWRSDLDRKLLAGALAGVPLLWFVPDWWGSGDPLHGADTAQVLGDVAPVDRFLDAVDVAWGMVPAPVWILAAVAVVVAHRRRDRAVPALAAGAAAWTLVVVVMAAALGYAAISRFFLPAAALVCVLGGVGAVHLARLVRADDRTGTRAVALVGAIAGIALVLPRAGGVPTVLAEARDRARLEQDLDRVLEAAGGREQLGACGDVAVTGRGLLRSSVAWKLDLPLHAVQLGIDDGTGTVIVREGGRRDRAVATTPGSVELARTDEWVVAAVSCPDALPNA